jgi:putative glutamine amidotransferase
MTTPPVIGIPVCIKKIDGLPFHAVGEKYIAAVAFAAGGLPFLLPALGPAYDIAALVERLDGLFLTGSRSNVEPHHYGRALEREESPDDPARDATTLPLIRAALEQGVPLLAVCRGLQELNVALGGTLHQQVHLVEGKLDHRMKQGVPYEEAYGPRHSVAIVPGGMLARILAVATIEVNSLHWQAIDRPAPRIQPEAMAPDGVIEAASVKDARTFALGVQWHPEYRATDNPVSMAIFRAFGEAASARARQRRARSAGVKRRQAAAVAVECMLDSHG